ncbi:hypothetical protein CSC94_18775 [Zhengella mangrovi]|uniref:Uncharacterized protein n=1 Tax=Zhengella mangrovi TaxID=1982044 RepID=A0A2G1QIQ9_9HYPH|nr:hypothetical protein [Zhengella mangrovi]PHP65406.1 hypothetical protein CSC94_18775 [Zhengella mangrovi]
MVNGWERVYEIVAGNALAAFVAFFALIAAAIAAYAGDQIRSGTYWALKPVSRQLPWNRGSDAPNSSGELSSVFTLVQLFLFDASGCRARYRKTTFFVAHHTTTTYQEAVTAEHVAAGFVTMCGTIVDTVVERGFYVSQINLGSSVSCGEHFANVYSADLLGSFTRPHEHWTQEFTYPTGHLILQVHFPAERPPKLIASKIVEGATEKPADTSARIINLYSQKSIVWDIAKPKPHQALKLEWTW